MSATWKLAKGKTWRQKLEADHPKHGTMVPVPAAWQKRYGRGMMLIPRPMDVDAILRKVRKGQLITQSQIRERLAKDAGAQSACPMSTGIFMRMVAEAAEEDRAAGKKRITPYWRTIKDDGKLNEKLPGGALAQAALLESEGHEIVPGTGKQPPRIVGYENSLVQP